MGKVRRRLATFLANFAVIGPTDSWDEGVLDDDRSQYPWDAASGFWSWGAGSQAITSVLLGQSGYWFKPETLIVENDGSIAQKLVIYDGNLSRTMFPMIVPVSDTVFIQKQQLRGMFFVSGVFASGGSTMTVRIGGKLLVSIPNGQV